MADNDIVVPAEIEMGNEEGSASQSTSTSNVSTSRGINSRPSSTKSEVWTYFDLCADQAWVKCRLCNTNVSRKLRTTTNMHNHLRKNHQEQYSLISKSPLVSSSQTRPKADDSSDMEGIEVLEESRAKKMKSAGPLDYAFNRKKPIVKGSRRWGELTHAITQFITKAMLPIQLVDNKWFVNLMKVLEPNYKVPSRSYFSQTAIPDVYNNAVKVVKKDVSAAEYFSITTDGWTSAVNMNPYISVTCHYIDASWELVTKNLATVYAPEAHTSENIAALMKNSLQEWGLSEKNLVAATTDNAANMKLAMKINKWRRIPCFGHVLHNGVKNAVDGDDRVKRAKGVAKRITAAFSHSTKKRLQLADAQFDLELPKHMLKTDCSTRWNSFYMMVERVLEQKDAIKRVLVEDRKTAHLLSGWWQDCEVMQEVTRALKPYANLTDALSGEKHITISAIIPLLDYVLTLNHSDNDPSDLDVDDEIGDESQLASDLKKKISDYMEPRLKTEGPAPSDQDQSFYAMATLLDPRYKTYLQSSSEVLYTAARLNLVEQGKVILDENLALSGDRDEPKQQKQGDTNTQDATALQTLPKRKSLSLADILSNVTETKDSGSHTLTTREMMKKEFELYINSPPQPVKTANGYSNPLAWWKKNHHCFPTLASLAKKHLCSPATSVSSERLFSKSGNVLSLKRNKLSPEMAQKLVFLAANDWC